MFYKMLMFFSMLFLTVLLFRYVVNIDYTNNSAFKSFQAYWLKSKDTICILAKMCDELNKSR